MIYIVYKTRNDFWVCSSKTKKHLSAKLLIKGLINRFIYLQFIVVKQKFSSSEINFITIHATLPECIFLRAHIAYICIMHGRNRCPASKVKNIHCSPRFNIKNGQSPTGTCYGKGCSLGIRNNLASNSQ